MRFKIRVRSPEGKRRGPELELDLDSSSAFFGKLSVGIFEDLGLLPRDAWKNGCYACSYSYNGVYSRHVLVCRKDNTRAGTIDFVSLSEPHRNESTDTKAAGSKHL